jgi:hypothetical protein
LKKTTLILSLGASLLFLNGYGKDSKEISSSLCGAWRGDVVQNMIDRQAISLVALFNEDKSCSIVCSVDSIITGLGVTKTSEWVHLKGSWELAKGGVLATMRQEEWKQKSQHFDGPGRTGPVKETPRITSRNEILFFFAYDPAKQLVTYFPMRAGIPSEKSQVSSADGSNLFIMKTIDMEKIENPLPDGNH